MATRSVTRAVQQAYQSPSRLFPFLAQQQGLCRPAFEQDAEKTLHVSTSQFAFSPSNDECSCLGFPPHPDAGKSHGSFLFFNKPPLSATVYSHLDGQLHSNMQSLGLHILSQDKVQLQDFTYLNLEALWKCTNLNYFPPSTEMDEVILPSQNEDVTSPMLMSTKRTFNPSTIVRKRRHGFLARKATVGGRRILARRFAKGRRRLSA